jgi:hypothetical protein
MILINIFSENLRGKKISLFIKKEKKGEEIQEEKEKEKEVWICFR